MALFSLNKGKYAVLGSEGQNEKISFESAPEQTSAEDIEEHMKN